MGTLAFLSMHILLESTAPFAPHLYDALNSGLRNPVALTVEIPMAFLVIFRGVNGLRQVIFDFGPGPMTRKVLGVLMVLFWLLLIIVGEYGILRGVPV